MYAVNETIANKPWEREPSMGLWEQLHKGINHYKGSAAVWKTDQKREMKCLIMRGKKRSRYMSACKVKCGFTHFYAHVRFQLRKMISVKRRWRCRFNELVLWFNELVLLRV